MFRHICVTLREFHNSYYAKLRKLLKIKMVKIAIT